MDNGCLRWLGRDEPDVGDGRAAVERIIRDSNLRPGTRKDGATEPRLSVPSPSLCIRTESVSTAELLLKEAAAGGAFDRHLEGLATFRHRLLIRGSLVRSQLGEPI